MMITRLSVACTLLIVLTARTGVLPANTAFAQSGSELHRCQQLYQSHIRCYETGKDPAYDVFVATAHHVSEELLRRSGQNHSQELAIIALESACLLGCETAKADTFLACHDFERAMCP
jgi:hypothetical protein